MLLKQKSKLFLVKSDMKNKLKNKANTLFDKGSYKASAKVFIEVYNLDEYNEKRMLIRAARCYELMKDNSSAIKLYIQVAREYAESGFFLKAIASLKNVLGLEPKHAEIQELIADLYAKNGSIYEKKEKTFNFIKNDHSFEPEKAIDIDIDNEYEEVIPEGQIIQQEDDFSEDEIFANQISEPPAIPTKINTIDASTLIKPLPEIPLFSKLDKEVFIDLMNNIKLKTYHKGALVIKEGDKADALYIILSGEVKITKELSYDSTVEIARLSDGSFFGEMALIGKAKRMASVEATTDLELFVISKDMLEEIIQNHASIKKTLFQFYRNRLLYNIINFSPMFKDVEKEKRLNLIKKFKSKKLFMNQILIHQNGEIPGLFLVLEGKIKVYRFLEDGTRQDVINLSRGSILGEMSLLGNTKPMAYCTTLTKTWVLRLPPEEFSFLKENYPEVIEYLNNLKDDRVYELDLLGKLNAGLC